MKALKNKTSPIRAFEGGGDRREDWVWGYELKLTLNNINWRKGIKLIIHIVDDDIHGEEFIKGDIHPQ